MSTTPNFANGYPYSAMMANYMHIDSAHFAKQAMRKMDNAKAVMSENAEYARRCLDSAVRQQLLSRKYHMAYMARMDAANYDEFGYCGPRVADGI